jgi:hypothetical protein
MKTGDPNGGGLPAWPKYTSAKGDICETLSPYLQVSPTSPNSGCGRHRVPALVSFPCRNAGSVRAC